MNSNIILPGFEEVTILKAQEIEGQYIIHFEMPIKPHKCPECGKLTSHIHDYRLTKIKHLKFSERKTILFYRKRRYRCTCGKRFAEQNPIVERYQRFSKEWNQMAQVRAVKGKTIKEMKELPPVIAIDEFKGNADKEKFQLIIANAVTREPIDILPNRKKETIEAYLHQYGENVQTVVMDMSHSFKAAVTKSLGKPIIIADRFHFVRYINWAIERVRIRVQSEWNDYDRKKIKRKRFVFLKKSQNLTDYDQWYLARYCTFSDELKLAYELKEHFYRWFEAAKVNGKEKMKQTKKGLQRFYKKVERSRIPEFIRTIQTFKNWETEILNSFSFGYSNGFVEGLNNLTKVLKRNAFGFRRFDRLRAKILLTHQYKDIGNTIG
ncbi:ISL3 family transposase [Rummeliibacillus sp. TYF005]|uniref:ISL3 family transposase n=1 Tax=Rummeliibacillus sp. TYF005 TaxID=2058214 RepID=UPI000F51B8FE|nr:ISL3 family transposase [Rummeliibacillus sp. TYF005]RPJ97166.1 ISL3 family transposase [Rummeliibacillus sp. TYF005]